MNINFNQFDKATYPFMDDSYFGDYIPVCYGKIAGVKLTPVNSNQDSENSDVSAVYRMPDGMSDYGTAYIKDNDTWKDATIESVNYETGLLAISNGRGDSGITRECKLVNCYGYMFDGHSYARQILQHWYAKYGNIQYTDSNFDKTEWESELDDERFRCDIGFLLDDYKNDNPKDAIDYFNKTVFRISKMGGKMFSRVDYNAEGKITARLKDFDRASSAVFASSDIKNARELKGKTAKDSAYSEIDAKYFRNYAESDNTFLSLVDNTYQQYVKRNFRIMQSYSDESYLINIEDAKTRTAEVALELKEKQVKFVVDIYDDESSDQDVMGIRLYDVITVALQPDNLDSSTRQYAGNNDCLVVGINPHFDSGYNTVTVQIIKDRTPLEQQAAVRTEAYSTVSRQKSTIDLINDTIDDNLLLTGNLSVPSISVVADNTGHVSDFSAATGVFVVKYSNTDVTGNGPVYSVVSQANCTGSIGESTGIYSITDLSGDVGTLLVKAVYEGKTIETGFTVTKSYTGATGGTGETVNLASDNTVFNYDAAPTPSYSTVTATLYNHIGTVYYDFYVDGVSVQNTTSNVYSYTPETLYADMPQNITVRVRDGSTTGDVIAIDSLDMYGVINGTDGTDGLDGMTFIQENASQTVPADAIGTVSSYAGTDNVIRVFEGSTELQATTGTPSAGQYKVTAVGTDITAGAVSVSGKTAVVAVSSAMTSGTAVKKATVNYTIIGKRINNTEINNTMTQGITKAVAGSDSTAITISDPSSTTPESGMYYDNTYYGFDTIGQFYKWTWDSSTTGYWTKVDAEIPQNPIGYFTGDNVPELPIDKTIAGYLKNKDFATTDGWSSLSGVSISVENSMLKMVSTIAGTNGIYKTNSAYQLKHVRVIVRCAQEIQNITTVTGDAVVTPMQLQKVGDGRYIADIYWSRTGSDALSILPDYGLSTTLTWYIEAVFVGYGDIGYPCLDRESGLYNANNFTALSAVCDTFPAICCNGFNSGLVIPAFTQPDVFTLAISACDIVPRAKSQSFFCIGSNVVLVARLGSSVGSQKLLVRTYDGTSAVDTYFDNFFVADEKEISVIINSVEGSVTVYRDGAYFGQETGLTIVPQSGVAYIGKDSTSAISFYGYLLNCLLYDRALRSTEIAGHARGLLPTQMYQVPNYQNQLAASDGVIATTEKTGVLTLFNNEKGKYDAIVATATAYGVSHDAIDAAYDALHAYLYTTPGVLVDFTVNTTIDKDTYQGLWDDLSKKYSDQETANTAAKSAAEAGNAQTAAQNFASGLNSQLAAQTDHALMIWDQASTSDPADAWTTDALKTDHNGDYWYKSDLSTWWRYARTGVNTGSWSQITSATTVTWLNASKTAAAAASVADGKSTVWPSYAAAQSSAVAGDLFLDSANTIGFGVSVEYVCLTALAATYKRITPHAYGKLSTAPSSGMIANDTYYNNTTFIWYRYTGSAWVSTSNVVQYNLTADHTTFIKSRAGVVTPGTVLFSAIAGEDNYAGRFRVYTTLDKVTYTLQSESTVDETSHAYTIPSTGICGIRARLYVAGGFMNRIATVDYAVNYSEDVAPEYLGIGVLTNTSTKSFTGATVDDDGVITPGGTVSNIIPGDSMTGYVTSTDVATLYYWSGSEWVATTAQKYVSSAAFDILNLSTAGYTVANYTIITNAIIKNLMVSNLKLLTGGKLFAGTGTFGNANTPIFLGYDTDGIAKFSLGDSMIAASGDISITGTINATAGRFSSGLGVFTNAGSVGSYSFFRGGCGIVNFIRFTSVGSGTFAEVIASVMYSQTSGVSGGLFYEYTDAVVLYGDEYVTLKSEVISGVSSTTELFFKDDNISDLYINDLQFN